MHLTLKPTVFEEKCDTIFGDVFSIYLEESVGISQVHLFRQRE